MQGILQEHVVMVQYSLSGMIAEFFVLVCWSISHKIVDIKCKEMKRRCDVGLLFIIM